MSDFCRLSAGYMVIADYATVSDPTTSPISYFVLTCVPASAYVKSDLRIYNYAGCSNLRNCDYIGYTCRKLLSLSAFSDKLGF